MEVKIKAINSYSQEMSVELGWKEIADDFNQYIRKFGKQIKMPGFRPGKVPRPVLMKQFLPVIEAKFVDENVQKYYIDALRQEEVTPVNKAEIKDVHFHYEEHLNFTAAYEVEIEVKMPELKKNSIKATKIEYITDEQDLILTIEDMRRSQAEMRTVETGAKEGNFVLADLQKIDESSLPIIGEKLEKRYLKIGDGAITGENQKKMLGVKAGDKIRLLIPDDVDQKESAYEISVINVEEQILPTVDMEFVKTMDPEAKNVEEWKKSVSERIEKSYQQRAEEQFDRNISDALIELINPEFAPSMVESYLEQIIEDIKTKNAGAKLDEEKIRETYRPLSERNLKWYSIRKAIIKEQEFEITADAINSEINRLAEEAPKQAKEIKKYYKKPSNKQRLTDDLMEKKILNYLIDFTKVKKVKVYTKNLRKNEGK